MTIGPDRISDEEMKTLIGPEDPGDSWIDDADIDDEGEVDVEWYPLPAALVDIDGDDEADEDGKKA